MNRRGVLRGLLLSSAYLAFADRIWAEALADEIDAVSIPKWLNAICDLVIPETETPGALAVGVPQFVVLALEHEFEGGRPGDLAVLESELVATSGRPVDELDLGEFNLALAELDANAFASDSVGESVWPRIKSLIVMGYYTSEAGASEELHYVLDPGRWDPDIPADDETRAYSLNVMDL